MPVFFFDIQDGKTRSPDTEGTEYLGIAEAQADAIRMLVAIAQDEWHDGVKSALAVQVYDDKRRPVVAAKIDCAVTVYDGPLRAN
ncbi:hypothetical protein LB577_32765 [Mesorhizobium sp. B283B1A]|uniref:DUF6894 family protein n=1 Tax=Mesorhizobium TaxID=68287 RepID=UPI001CD12C0E|nr:MULTISPECIES: hypothetical protein [Mesorhizobium]MCA0051676.1 hypothetical protein [Mesorhizobium sp. B283B1A]UQS64325.1 hypothetical protein M5D98_30250 [Mesorhizobium opportunistum]